MDRSKLPRLETARLILEPMREDAVRALIARWKDADPELAQAYTEMLDGAVQHPGEYLWYIPWGFFLREGGVQIGDACFKGLPADGRPEIGYGLEQTYWGRGYATEGAAALCRWALSQQTVVSVEAETAPDNAASQRVLEKLGFRPTGENGEEGPRFTLLPDTGRK